MLLRGERHVLGLPIEGVSSQCGSASWYALHSNTASGERMNPALMTAAHRTLPFGTTLKVINRQNGRSVVVRINDRGPFVKSRMIDLSKAAACQLGFLNPGRTSVCMLPTPSSARLARI
ncbi:septal ring lytic transglycosylase RlpA family protein [Mesorhizobium sangaii]|uniref:septal ring lytic transglycosylase RlpA family protein n=1 Tax=Mesorhizobium sangaii TaxID=505389 RepID=UPI00161AF323|nr:septal ring lytic transglycosylase RlpA family protein [Mesorhizobium sangaii]